MLHIFGFACVPVHRSRRSLSLHERRFRLACAALAAFVLFAGRCPAQTVGRADEELRQAREEEDAAERLSSEELLARVPGLQVFEQSPAVVFGPKVFFVNLPYQWLAIGAAVDLAPVPWLRLGASYAIGLSLERSQSRASHYAEASLGLRVLGFQDDVAVDFYPNGYPTLSRPRVTIIKAWLPARHGLFVEGGGTTALAFLAHCRGSPCDELVDAETVDGQQLVMPFAGLRYTLDYRVESKRPGMGKGLWLQVYAHALAKPLEVESADRFLSNGDSAGTPGWGFRAGAKVTGTGGGNCLVHFLFGWQCIDVPGLGAGVELGYAPYPRSVLARLGVDYSIY